MATIVENVGHGADGVQNIKNDFASALRSKGINPADKKLKEYPALVRQIGSTNLSFVTAGAVDILEGKVGADRNGNPIYGVLTKNGTAEMSFFKCTSVTGEEEKSTTPDCVVCGGIWGRGIELYLVDDTAGSRVWENGEFKIVQNYNGSGVWAALENNTVVLTVSVPSGYESYWNFPWDAFYSPYTKTSLYVKPAALPSALPKLWNGYKATLKSRNAVKKIPNLVKVENSGGNVFFPETVTSGPGATNTPGIYWRSPMYFTLVNEYLEGTNRVFYGNDEWLFYREDNYWRVQRMEPFGSRDTIATLGYLYATEPVGTFDISTLEFWAEYNGGTVTAKWEGEKEISTVEYYWEFSNIETKNMQWGKGFTPQVGRIYNDEATVIVSSLFNTGQYDENETVVAVQKNSFSGDYTAIGFFISTGAQCIIDWGDGIVETINPGSSIEVSHNYGAAIEREHIIRIKGDVVHSIQVDGRGERSSTLLTHLIQLGNSLTSMYQMFYGCHGLTSIDDTVQIPDGVTSMHEAFDGCGSLSYAPATLRMPANCTDYVHAFYIPGLHTDMTHWFDKFADIPAGTKINMSYGFGGYLQNGVSGVTGTLPADLLWNNSNITWISTAYCFYGRTSLSNYDEIPASWKG